MGMKAHLYFDLLFRLAKDHLLLCLPLYRQRLRLRLRLRLWLRLTLGLGCRLRRGLLSGFFSSCCLLSLGG